MSQVLLKDFLAQQQNHNLTENLTQVILTIASTCQDIDAALQKGALAGILGTCIRRVGRHDACSSER